MVAIALVGGGIVGALVIVNRDTERDLASSSPSSITAPTVPAAPTTTVDLRPPPDPQIACHGQGDDRYLPYDPKATAPPAQWPTMLLRYDETGQRIAADEFHTTSFQSLLPFVEHEFQASPTAYVLVACVLKVRTLNPLPCKYQQIGGSEVQDVTFYDVEYRASLHVLHSGEQLKVATIVQRHDDRCPQSIFSSGSGTSEEWSVDPIIAAFRPWLDRKG